MKRVSLVILCLCITSIEVQAKKSIRASSRGSRKTAARMSGTSKNFNTNINANKSENISKKTEIKESIPTEESWDSAVCDSEYTRCMNRICSDESLGKCVCYEDKITNNMTPKFLDFDGMKVKQGFETLEYAKKQCMEILDKCKSNRRSITEKYKNLVQRDCLMISKNEVASPKGLSKDLINLKECLKDACSVMIMEGYEDFSYPEYSLCFNDSYAKFATDVFCLNIVAKSSSPLGVKQLFLDEMALKREKSCKSMGGTLSNDRKKCYVTVEYGISKNNIKASKQVPVGEYVECSATSFGAKQNETWEKKQADLNKALSLVATGFNTAGAMLGAGGTLDPIGSLVSSGIDIAESGTDLAIQIKGIVDGDIKIEDSWPALSSNLLSFTLSGVSFGMDVTGLGEAMKQAAEATELAKTATDTASTATKIVKGLNTASTALNIGSTVADVVWDMEIDKEKVKEEQKALVQYGEVDRYSGQGLVNPDGSTMLEKGNCFINKEWFATENEIILLLWKN